MSISFRGERDILSANKWRFGMGRGLWCGAHRRSRIVVGFMDAPLMLAGMELPLMNSSLGDTGRLSWESYLARLICVCMISSSSEVSPENVRIRQRCAECSRTDHGRPYAVILSHSVRAPSVSWSHSHGVVAVAISYEGNVSIDVESDIGSRRSDLTEALSAHLPASAKSIPDRLLYDLVRLWTLRECLVKLGLISLTEAVSNSYSEERLLSYFPDVDSHTWASINDSIVTFCFTSQS